MNTYLMNCTKCETSLPLDIFNTSELSHCPSCDVPIRVDVFPAIFERSVPGQLAESLILGNESSCFFHPQKKAVVPCAICGRFLCALCDVEFNNQHVCPSCLETGKKKRKIKNLETHRVLYDNIALSLTIIPLLFLLLLFWVTIITAPISLYIAIRHWKSPSSIIPRTKIRFIIAFFLASLQIAGWVSFFTYILIV